MKNIVVIGVIIVIAAGVYLQNPINLFNMQHIISSKDCKVTDSSLSKVYDGDFHCEKYDVYFANANVKWHTKYSDELTQAFNRCISQCAGSGVIVNGIHMSNYDFCSDGRQTSDASEQAEEKATQIAQNKCKEDADIEKMLLLSGSTNCNQEESFDFIIYTSYLGDRVVSKGKIVVKDGTFKKVVNIGERMYNSGSYEVFIK